MLVATGRLKHHEQIPDAPRWELDDAELVPWR